MIIHKSHSKKELLEIVEYFHFPIDNSEEMNKDQLTSKMILVFNDIPEIIPDYDILLVNNKDELRRHLINKNQDKSLSIRERNKIMRKAKRIIAYCKNGYDITKSSFCSLNSLLDEANEVAENGNIPTCRRAIKLLNMDIKINYVINLKISKKIQRELDIKKQYEIMNGTSGLMIKREKVIVKFD
tara:strand:- start:3810 stop:4364 length:555 start_codon:yes stop_codon:yes gene_type:complete